MSESNGRSGALAGKRAVVTGGSSGIGLAGHWPSVDVVFANAGASNAPEPVWDTTDAEFDAVIDVNLKSAFFTVTGLQPMLAPRASVILCSSASYHRGTIGDALCAAENPASRARAKSRTRISTKTLNAEECDVARSTRPFG